MSRAPKVESAYVPLHASIGAKDVIDFVDNSLQTLAPGVMGGPPAYLEAHGIRYVPATELSSGEPSDERAAPPAAGPDPRPALNSRIRDFVQGSAYAQGSLGDEYAPVRPRRPTLERSFSSDPAVRTERLLRQLQPRASTLAPLNARASTLAPLNAAASRMARFDY